MPPIDRVRCPCETDANFAREVIIESGSNVGNPCPASMKRLMIALSKSVKQFLRDVSVHLFKAMTLN